MIMAKRLVQSDKLGPAKKPKLDISVKRGRIGTSTSTIVEFWASDDDDDVLLATQKAEEIQRKSDVTQNTLTEFVFTGFATNAQVVTSTQQGFGNEILGINRPTSPGVEEMFGTDETFVFLPDPNIEKKKDLGITEVGTATKKLNHCPTSLNTENRRQLAQERQLKFLMERVDSLKKENTKLQKDLLDSSKQVTTKDGEVCLLRNELHQVRKLLQASKLTVTAEKNKALKQIMAKDVELNFTNVEFNELKIRNAGLNQRNSTIKPIARDFDENRRLLRIDNFCINTPFGDKGSSKTITSIHKFKKDKPGPKKQQTFLEVELEQLLVNYAQIQAEPAKVKNLLDRIFTSACSVFSEFWRYTLSLESPQNALVYPYYQFDLQSNRFTTFHSSLNQPAALERAVILRHYITTLALICQQESVLAQTILTKKFGKYSIIEVLIDAITNLSYSFEVFDHSGVLKATSLFLQSLLTYKSSLKQLEASQNDLLFQLLKQLVFARPSPLVFYELSACVLLSTRDSQLIGKMCVNCPNCYFVSDRVRSIYRFLPKSCLIQVYSGLIELCFCGDMPLSPDQFKLLLAICENHVRFVYQCFTATPEFILRMVSFPSFTDDDKEDNEEMFSKVVNLKSDGTLNNNSTVALHASLPTAANMPKASLTIKQEKGTEEVQCECYVKMCLSVVTIVYQMMYQWMLQEEKSDISQVGTVSQLSIHLLTLIFREYYLTCIFRDSEETTKHYLSLLCNWWNNQAHRLKFDDKHLRFLKHLQELQFMLKPLHQESNPANPSDDLTEWKTLVSNGDESVPTNIHKDITHITETLFSHNTFDFFNGSKGISPKVSYY